MNGLIELREHLDQRVAGLQSLKAKGTRIVGYIPTGYVPDELIWASGAVPVGLIRGGDHEPVITADSYLFRFLDTFARAQIGYRLLGEPIYQLPDLIVALITDRNILAAAEMWQLNTKVEVFKYGVPSRKDTQHAFDYYLNGLQMLRKRLGGFTGREITDDVLRNEIITGNRIRSLLEEISNSRKSGSTGISGKDFIFLNHATYIADRQVLIQALESINTELKKQRSSKSRKPRIMLTGSTLAYGDNTLVDLLEKSGADIVIEEFSEGIRHYWQKVGTEGDPLTALAERYLRQRPPPAFFKNCKQEKFAFLFKLIKEFNVGGVIWYSLMYRDGYDRWGVLFPQALQKDFDIPFLKLNSGYDPSEAGTMRTRIEAFVETLNVRS